MSSRRHGHGYGHDSRGSTSRSSSSHRSSHRPGSEISREEDADGGQREDHGFNFEKHKYVMNKMFFGARDKIETGTKEHQEFWVFLRKYQALRKRGAGGGRVEKVVGSVLVPEWDDVEALMSTKGCIFNDHDSESSETLTKERVAEFRNIVVLYLDFLEKQKAKALARLREQQALLPIAKYREKILEAVAENSVLLIAGDTGCGKSTQVPQYLLNAGYESIACTQPRRIACIALCKRVAYETQKVFGSDIGYEIRFDKKKKKYTKITFLTEGLLLRQVASDPMLSNHEVIILDEVHERHLTCDFLLGIMKCLIFQRPKDLKVILMSATINTQLFSTYFADCPVIEVPGRLHPIQVQYFPVSSVESYISKSKRINPAPYLRAVQMIDDMYPSTERGDLLVFLSGLSEITTVADTLKMYAQQNERWIILQLHSSLSIADQDKVFDVSPDGVRKCILATNIAETSVTIDGIRFVIDSGKVKEISYDPNCRMQRLQEFWISKASAEQRKGRAGRTGPGVCFRLYAQKDLDEFVSYTSPEIRRVPLDCLLLQMISMGLPDARRFPFLEPPSIGSLEEAILSLKENGALTAAEELTPMGKMLSRLPVDITVGKMLVLGSVFNIIDPMLSLAASLSVQSPLTNKSHRDSDALAARTHLESDHGDPFILLNAYNKWLEIKADQSEDSRKWCRKRGLEEQRFYEITKLRRQFKDLLNDAMLLDSDVDREAKKGASSSERIQRHGELNQLRAIKRQHDSSAPRKRKLLKMTFDCDASGPEEDPLEIDMKDIDFRLSHNRRQVEALRSASQAYSQSDIILMKMVLCSGLYPQIAIADDHNNYKPESDQLFHTKNKPFTGLHPTGIFALKPEMLMLSEAQQRTDPLFICRLSEKHSLVAYVSLLETTKPYLCNCVRVPAAHTLLLLSHLDTNLTMTRIVCDQWLELLFPSAEAAQKLISQAFQVRDLWQQLLEKVFEECFKLSDGNPDEDRRQRSAEVNRMERKLIKSITSFLDLKVSYGLKRLLAADIKNLYIGATLSGGSETNETTINDSKGGIEEKSYLTYNCLRDDEANLSKGKLLRKPWVCLNCEQELTMTVLERVRHQEQCLGRSRDGRDAESKSLEHPSSSSLSSSSAALEDPLKKRHFCTKCKQDFVFTATEILRHNKNH